MGTKFEDGLYRMELIINYNINGKLIILNKICTNDPKLCS